MKDYLATALKRTLMSIPSVPKDFVPELSAPANPDHGDLATNCAMKLARHLRRPPRMIAEEIKDVFMSKHHDPFYVDSVSIAGGGFINFRFANSYLYHELESCLNQGLQFGRSDHGQGKRALVEFVSANPTGPLTVGHGRNAVLGDTQASLLEWIGYDVTREYYFNDAGRQMRVLGASVRSRYEEIVAEETQPFASLPRAVQHRECFQTKTLEGKDNTSIIVADSFPEDGYLGEYIITIARELVREHGIDLLDAPDNNIFEQAAKLAIFSGIRSTLERLGITMEHYFNEKSLYDSGAVTRTLNALRGRKMIYEQDGATWFKTSKLGKETDTVLVKRTGEPTYRLPDIAYHIDKMNRGYDVIINIFGADHIGTYPDILRGLDVLGFDSDRIKVVIYQFVTLTRAGEEVKMSTRKANFVTLDELMDEVTPDVTRYFFVMRSAQKHLEFDLDLAREASDKNPVFYLQYAHARISSILTKASELHLTPDPSPSNLNLLIHEAEIALIKEIIHFPQAITSCAEACEPHRLATYLRGIAEVFTRFYHACRIIGEEEQIATARLALAQATGITLRNGLSILGISAPERM
ncbi:MAG: arginine--tRNA ligase [Bacteroidetes bacterium]|nr:arginine--tRNA ligase [Bacteroidota bacterium]MCY4206198.1 arginine--tRNA ligase [Bacteroidota bacterium]